VADDAALIRPTCYELMAALAEYEPVSRVILANRFLPVS